jgi:hypothetical protein
LTRCFVNFLLDLQHTYTLKHPFLPFPASFLIMASPDPAVVILSYMSDVADMLPFNKEYETVEATFLKDLGSPKACVSAIFKIRNAAMKAAFDARCADIAAKRGAAPTVITAYHGTSLAAASSIARDGFNPAYNTTAAYGKGTYASAKPATALQYCKDVKTTDNFSMVFMCDFAKGKFGSPGASKAFTAACDYSGTVGKDDIVVTPYADGILPQYLICFYKWAV